MIYGMMNAIIYEIQDINMKNTALQLQYALGRLLGFKENHDHHLHFYDDTDIEITISSFKSLGEYNLNSYQCKCIFII